MTAQKKWQPPGLFGLTTWQGIWLAIRRTPHHEQSRKMLVALIGFVVYIGGFVAYQVWAWRSAARDGMLGFQALLVLSLLGGSAVIYAWRRKQGTEDLRILVPTIEIHTVSAHAAQDIWRSTLILSLWLERAASEIFLATKEIPANVEVVTRQSQMATVRRLGIEQDLPEAIRDHVYLPDGHWREELRTKAGIRWEYLTVLRWVVQIDSQLRPLDWNPNYDLQQAKEVVDRYDARNGVLASWDIRPERDIATLYCSRLWSEAVLRDLIATIDAHTDLRARAEAFRGCAEVEGLEQEFMLGARKLHELNDNEILAWFARCSARAFLLDTMVNILSSDAPADLLLAKMFQEN